MEDTTQIYKALSENVRNRYAKTKSKPKPKVEEEITEIFIQARKHRSLLIGFYVSYTILVTLLVCGLLGVQAQTRIHLQDSNFEIIPQWALNILVVGMFGQFVGLLTIVTKCVWNFGDFFEHHNQMIRRKGDRAA